ncbi:MAG: tRNA (adenosine(37)-N6)-dimethylallyltransferase MiaA [Aquificota bacterium]|nr:tRNA (adenosine(37)-N6)-dimethylallyltransferase MiaA [Aquificota bacterium]
MRRKLLVIGGPTAVGKSETACQIAQKLGGEIVSADSMTVYRGMDIGTAKPLECMEKVRHHLIDVVDPGDYFDAKIFEEKALKAIEDITGRGKVPLVVGGTYLYLQALLYGIEETPEPDWKLRRRLYAVAERKGSGYLYERLRVVDPVYARKIHPNDLRRIVRALEVFIATGKPFSSFHRWERPRLSFAGFVLMRSWESLSKRIEERLRSMIERGLLDEIRGLLNRGFKSFLTSPQAINYKEFIPYLEGKVSFEEAFKEAVRNTREYARRQIRWFRKQGWTEVDLDRLGREGAVELIVRNYLQDP